MYFSLNYITILYIAEGCNLQLLPKIAFHLRFLPDLTYELSFVGINI